MIGIGRESTSTPAIAHMLPTSLPTPGLQGWEGSQMIILTWCGRYISITHGGHGHHNPVESSGDWGEAGIIVHLDEVGETRKDEATDDNEKDKKKEFLIAVF